MGCSLLHEKCCPFFCTVLNGRRPFLNSVVSAFKMLLSLCSHLLWTQFMGWELPKSLSLVCAKSLCERAEALARPACYKGHGFVISWPSCPLSPLGSRYLEGTYLVLVTLVSEHLTRTPVRTWQTSRSQVWVLVPSPSLLPYPLQAWEHILFLSPGPASEDCRGAPSEQESSLQALFRNATLPGALQGPR